MAINSVTSSTNTQAVLPQPKPAVKPADAASQPRQAEAARPAEQPKPQPVVNNQGQTVGGVVNTTA